MNRIATPFILLVIVFFAISINSDAQDVKDKPDIQTLVEAKRFVVQVQSVSPQRGGLRQLTPGYTFTVLPDTVISYLPYFGRAYQATIDPTDAGIKFTSTDFQYEAKNRKKGGWDISIRPKDSGKAYQIFLTITSAGYASMRIVSSDRESISYNGRVESVPE